MKSAVLDTMDDLEVGIDQLLPTTSDRPTGKDLWAICTESQWVSRACGWEKIAKTSTDQFPDDKATVRANRNTGKPDMIYTVYFNYGTRTHTSSWGNYNTRSRLMVSTTGELVDRHFHFNGSCPTDGELQKITDTMEFIESKIQAASNG